MCCFSYVRRFNASETCSSIFVEPKTMKQQTVCANTFCHITNWWLNFHTTAAFLKICFIVIVAFVAGNCGFVLKNVRKLFEVHASCHAMQFADEIEVLCGSVCVCVWWGLQIFFFLQFYQMVVARRKDKTNFRYCLHKWNGRHDTEQFRFIEWAMTHQKICYEYAENEQKQSKMDVNSSANFCWANPTIKMKESIDSSVLPELKRNICWSTLRWQLAFF